MGIQQFLLKIYQKDWLVIGLILIINLIIKILHISEAPYWLDESHFVFEAQKSFKGIIDEALNYPNSPLYVVLLGFWVKLFGITEISTRSLSLLFNLLSIPLIYYFAKKYINKQSAVIAILFFSVSNLHLYYTHEARSYTIITFFTILSFYFFMELMKKPDGKALGKYAVANTLLLYTQIVPIFAIFAQFLASLFYVKKNRKGFIFFILGNFIAGTLFSIWIFFNRYYKRDMADAAWLEPPTVDQIYSVMVEFFNSRMVFFIFLLLVVLFVVQKYKSFNSGESKVFWISLLWGFIPVISVFVLSLFIPRFLPRYMLFATPGFYLAFALVISKLDFENLFRNSQNLSGSQNLSNDQNLPGSQNLFNSQNLSGSQSLSNDPNLSNSQNLSNDQILSNGKYLPDDKNLTINNNQNTNQNENIKNNQNFNQKSNLKENKKTNQNKIIKNNQSLIQHPNQILKYLIVVLILISMATKLNLNPYKGEPWDMAAEYVKENQTGNSITIVSAWYMFRPFSYYYDKAIFGQTSEVLNKLEQKDIYFGNSSGVFKKVNLEYYENLILVQAHDNVVDPRGTIVSYLNERYKLIEKKKVQGIKLAHYQLSEPVTVDSLFIDFENDTVSYNHLVVEHENAYSGNHVSMVDKDHEYSSGIDIPVSAIKERSFHQINIQVRVKFWDQSTKAKLVVSLENQDEIYFWKSKEIQQAAKINQWEKIDLSVYPPKEKVKSKDILKVFVWNNGETEVLVADILVGFME